VTTDPGGEVRAVVVDPTSRGTVYVATSAGVSKSTSGGRFWFAAGLSGEDVLSIAINAGNPDIVYAGTGSGVFESDDAGEEWRKLSNQVILGIFVDPGQPETLFGIDAGRNVFWSVDGGSTWSSRGAGLPPSSAVSFAADPLNPAILYIGTNVSGVYRSGDEGESWFPAGTGTGGMPVLALAVDATAPTLLYAGTYGGLLRSTDRAHTWAPANGGLVATFIQSVVIDPENEPAAYASSDVQAFVTTDRGQTWTAIAPASAFRIWAVDPKASNVLYASGSQSRVGHIYKSIDAGRSWSTADDGISCPFVNDLTIDPQEPSTVYAATRSLLHGPGTIPCGGLFRSTNGGATWNLLLNAYTSRIVVDPSDSNRLYVFAWNGSGPNYLARSTDGGASWSPIGPAGDALFPGSVIAIDPTRPMRLYAGAELGLYRSDDGGDSWTALDLPDLAPESVALDPFTEGTLYLSGAVYGAVEVLTSHDLGETWTPFLEGLPLLPSPPALAVNRQGTLVYAGTAGRGVFVREVIKRGSRVLPARPRTPVRIDRRP
jgi:photosystem II stability/assembly factor-like uncharacterized protein